MVLYKIPQTPLLIALPLLLPVARGGFRVRVPVVLLIVGMRGPPLGATVANDLGVLGIGLDFLTAIIGTPPALAFRLAANRLLPVVRRWMEGLLTVSAAASWDQ